MPNGKVFITVFKEAKNQIPVRKYQKLVMFCNRAALQVNINKYIFL